VFRTYNASFTLQNQLDELTEDDMSIPEKLLAYNRANRAVAILCNHQRAVPKTHNKSMDNLREKIRLKREQIQDVQNELKVIMKADYKICMRRLTHFHIHRTLNAAQPRERSTRRRRKSSWSA
jgi:Eukaryotic DNA topoisomerase I, catalytic core